MSVKGNKWEIWILSDCEGVIQYWFFILFKNNLCIILLVLGLYYRNKFKKKDNLIYKSYFQKNHLLYINCIYLWTEKEKSRREVAARNILAKTPCNTHNTRFCSQVLCNMEIIAGKTENKPLRLLATVSAFSKRTEKMYLCIRTIIWYSKNKINSRLSNIQNGT